MTRYVADTHALFWYLTASRRLGSKAKAAFDNAAAGNAMILLPTIVLAEIYFLNEKAGKPLDFLTEFNRLGSAKQFQFVALVPEDIVDFDADGSIPEMHDRIIAGVARRAGATCLTRDREITEPGVVSTLW